MPRPPATAVPATRPPAAVPATRPLAAAVFTAALAACATGLAALPAAASTGPAAAAPAGSAPSEVLYGFAWADGPSTLRITPAKATPVKQHGIVRYKLTPVPGAKERRIGYAGADFRRITAACDLKETEGVVKLDKKGLGKTRCKEDDLSFVLSLGPAPVRISTGAVPRVHEFIALPTAARTAFGTVKRVNDTTVVFAKGRSRVTLHYTFLDFHRATRRCGDSWLANHVNADRDGLGTKACDTRSFARAVKGARYPVLTKVEYDPVSRQLIQAWEVFGDA
ncbi:hypothetical protein GCM10010156_28700 [Planobispora rosea]|uniref:Lipoprotein n=1 Tax=Planobispora rosea TaxID=35762 RepID=A0A8J3RS38_PLARO|nr:hypothetical protein [Planobispora rosea]GGS68115.1 hypothetical protein GCM10010156_28700 [Planobispora rosea]GIH81956.1 hypothetical protein Pro02_03640 [Planobispora rosea]